jgi:prepilin-type N-terminal cleavage/methylation domain-containing protein
MSRCRRKGFTLVEVIVAVALLAVVTVPIISSMVRTTQINSKARLVQKATDLGQNLMEGIREYTMEEVIDQCLKSGNGFKIIYSSIISYNPKGYQYLDASGNFEQELQAAANKAQNGKNDPIYGMVDNNQTYTSYGGDKYNFAFCGIGYNNNTFDAVVTFEKYVDKSDDANGNQDTSAASPYCVYNVTVKIYLSAEGAHFADSAKLATLTGAVQNK